MHWYAQMKEAQKKAADTTPSPLKTPRTMSTSEEIAWLRESVLKKGLKDNPAYADAVKRLAELYAQNYPGVEEQD